MTDYMMPVVSLPPRKSRTVKDNALVTARREQLLATPNQWLLWDGAAPRFQEMNKILVRLMQLPSSTRVSRKGWPFKGATRKNADGTYSLYVGYFPDLSIKRS
jgi:hypothetical protein